MCEGTERVIWENFFFFGKQKTRKSFYKIAFFFIESLNSRNTVLEIEYVPMYVYIDTCF